MNRVKLSVLILAFVSSGFGQLVEDNHPELQWRTIETENFYIHFHQGTDRTAYLAAKISEEIYTPVTSLYQYRPKSKYHIIVRDHDDSSNGAAFYYDNKIEIWAPSMDFVLRGTHNWLRNVIAHEFTHMISLGAARKMPRQIPAIYFQWMGYEKEKREDVIYGFPNTLVSFPFAGTVIPMWYAEGMAQFQRYGLDYDAWDSHRDMLLRMAVLRGGLLSVNDMSVFGKNSVGNELVYNQGYALTYYIASHYGEGVLSRLAKAMKTPLRLDFNGALKQELGISESALFNEWAVWIKKEYETAVSNIYENSQTGDLIRTEGLANFYPALSPDGKSLAFLSSGQSDYLSLQNLMLMDIQSGRVQRLQTGITSSPSWSPDGKKLAYAHRKKTNRYGSRFYDIYIHDLESNTETRLTRLKRTRQPDWSPDGKWIVCVIEKDGTSNLAVLKSDGTELRNITSFEKGEQVFTPRWEPNGKCILFAISAGPHGRKIARIGADGQNLEMIIHTNDDNRDPFPVKEGFVYSSDKTGIFNLYLWNESDKQSRPITNVAGGAFMPHAANSGQIVYSLYTGEGFKLASLENPDTVAENSMHYQGPYIRLPSPDDAEYQKIAVYNDAEIPVYKSTPYRPIFAELSFLPRIMRDYPGKIKVGSYFYGSDYLNRISLFGGAAVNADKDMDLFGIFEYRIFLPTLFLEAYQQSRNTSHNDADYKFNLIEINLGADWQFGLYNKVRSAWVFSRYDAKMSFVDQNIPFKIGYTYHLGNAVQLKWDYKNIKPSTTSHISPRKGSVISLTLQAASQRFLKGFKVSENYGTLVEEYEPHKYFQGELDWTEYRPGLHKTHSIALRGRLGLIDRPVASFYHFFGGGLQGLKGYPFYSIEGRKLAQISLAYRFPLYDFNRMRFLFFNLRETHLSIYGGAGNAWNSSDIDLNEWKREAGMQIRLSTFAFYTYPMALFFDAAYGLDQFSHKGQEYGKEWRFYFGVLFDFLD